MQARQEQGLLPSVRWQKNLCCVREKRRQAVQRDVPDVREWREADEEGRESRYAAGTSVLC